MQALDRWEDRLEALFEGRPYDVLDAALTDTVSRYPVHIQPFRDMIDGMRMDLVKSRYRSYDELYGYCYKVAGTVALMTTPVMGIDPAYPVRLTALIGGPMEARRRRGQPCQWPVLLEYQGIKPSSRRHIGVVAGLCVLEIHRTSLHCPGVCFNSSGWLRFFHPGHTLACSAILSTSDEHAFRSRAATRWPLHKGQLLAISCRLAPARTITPTLQCVMSHSHIIVCLVQGPLEPVYKAALALGTANQLTNILRDVGERCRRAQPHLRAARRARRVRHH